MITCHRVLEKKHSIARFVMFMLIKNGGVRFIQNILCVFLMSMVAITVFRSVIVVIKMPYGTAEEKMIYPLISSAPKPSKDMPNDVKEVYEEARQVSVYSPRAAAALLRVALEKLTAHLGETTGNLNTRIGKLKAKGLPDKVIDSLDIVRISANEGGSHAGTIDLTGEDNQKIVNKLFSLVNFIVERTITAINVVNEMFDQLPEAKKEGIKNRDKQ